MASATTDSKHDHSHAPDHVHEEGMQCCAHHNVKLERYMLLYLIGGLLLLATVIAKYVLPDGMVPETVADIPAIIGAILLGFPLFVASGKELWRGTASTSTLCAIAILGSLAIGSFTTAGFLAFILLVADQFVRQRAWGAQRAIEDLVARTPDVARVVRNGSEAEVSLASVVVGDVVRVRAGENLPVDGVVVTGRSALDQAALDRKAHV